MRRRTTTIDQSLDKEKCIDFLAQYGYYIHKEDMHNLTLKKSGKTFTLLGKKMPLELSFSYRDIETKCSLKYDAFVLFDTGDLRKELDRIVSLLTTNINKLV